MANSPIILQSLQSLLRILNLLILAHRLHGFFFRPATIGHLYRPKFDWISKSWIEAHIDVFRHLQKHNFIDRCLIRTFTVWLGGAVALVDQEAKGCWERPNPFLTPNPRFSELVPTYPEGATFSLFESSWILNNPLVELYMLTKGESQKNGFPTNTFQGKLGDQLFTKPNQISSKISHAAWVAFLSRSIQAIWINYAKLFELAVPKVWCEWWVQCTRLTSASTFGRTPLFVTTLRWPFLPSQFSSTAKEGKMSREAGALIWCD